MLSRDLPFNYETIKRLISPFYLAILLSLFLTASGSSITLLTTPSLLCEQDIVEFNCTVTSPGFSYSSNIADLNINSSSDCISSAKIKRGDEPRLSVMSTGGTTSAPSAQYTISPFLLQDNMTQYRCCAANTSNFALDFTDFISLPLAAPPSATTNLSISSAYDSATSCTGTITLTWPAVTSDRNVTSYEVLLNGTNITTLTPTAGTNTYAISMSLATFNGRYTVRAVSCAGSSVSNEVVFTSPNPPNSFTATISCTRLNQLTNQTEFNISLPTIITDRPITHYTLYINNKIENTKSADGSNYEYSTILQLSSYSNINITTTAYSCAGSYSSITITDCVGDDVPPGLSTGAIVGIAVGGAGFLIIAIAVILLIGVVIYCVIKRTK